MLAQVVKLREGKEIYRTGEGTHWTIPVQLLELKKIDGKLKQKKLIYRIAQKKEINGFALSQGGESPIMRRREEERKKEEGKFAPFKPILLVFTQSNHSQDESWL